MTTFEFRLPDLGEGVAEGEVIAWHVAPGERVSEDQDMLEVMTDKATVMIGSPRAGIVAKLNATVGQRVSVGFPLILIDTSPSNVVALSSPTLPSAAPPRRRAAAPARQAEAKEDLLASAVGDIRHELPGVAEFARQLSASARPRPVPAVTQQVAEAPVGKPMASPATRRLARSLGIDLGQVRATGTGGVVTRGDLQTAAELTPASAGRREPLVGLRRRIAERMRLAASTAVPVTFVEEVHVDELKQMIESARPAAAARSIKLNYLPFIVKAVTMALRRHPILNASLNEERQEIIYHDCCHIGIATATPQGLMVPVLHHAESKSVLQIAEEIQHLAEGARAGKLNASELTGSTFTVTSLGRMSGLMATPMLNYPESGILSVHQLKKRPVVREDQIVIGHVMTLSLSFDHRLVDGQGAAAFTYDVIASLEQPSLTLLGLA